MALDEKSGHHKLCLYDVFNKWFFLNSLEWILFKFDYFTYNSIFSPEKWPCCISQADLTNTVNTFLLVPKTQAPVLYTKYTQRFSVSVQSEAVTDCPEKTSCFNKTMFLWVFCFRYRLSPESETTERNQKLRCESVGIICWFISLLMQKQANRQQNIEYGKFQSVCLAVLLVSAVMEI